MARLTSMQDLAVLRDEIKAKKDNRAKEVAICTGTGCLGLGAAKGSKKQDVPDSARGEP
ncbi:MAG: hypothetical protein CG443_810 [Methanosaeta sp. ASP1-1]|nr:MAG: hypothetical protein CG443_810 [Methanosaeta sp. ASP1-1]